MIALDPDAARIGIRRDLAEFASAGIFGKVALGLLLGLPLVSVALLIVRRWLASVPLVMSGLLFLTWFSYYASPRSTVTGSAASGVLLYVLLGWSVLLLAVIRPLAVASRQTSRSKLLDCTRHQAAVARSGEATRRLERLRKGGRG